VREERVPDEGEAKRVLAEAWSRRKDESPKGGCLDFEREERGPADKSPFLDVIGFSVVVSGLKLKWSRWKLFRSPLKQDATERASRRAEEEPTVRQEKESHFLWVCKSKFKFWLGLSGCFLRKQSKHRGKEKGKNNRRKRKLEPGCHPKESVSRCTARGISNSMQRGAKKHVVIRLTPREGEKRGRQKDSFGHPILKIGGRTQ